MMTLSPEVKHAIQEAALDAGLPISIVTGIVCQESSGWRNRKPRYEPGFFKRYVIKLGLGSIEAQERATSWGPMQVMGQTAREMGFTGDFESQLHTLEVGLYWGCRHLKNLHKRYFTKHGWGGVISAYNAGSPRRKGDQWVNQESYVTPVLLYAQESFQGEG